MIKIKMSKKGQGNLVLKLSNGKKFTITKDNIETWDRVEVMECPT